MKRKVIIKPKTINVSNEELNEIKQFMSDNGFQMEITHIPKELWK